MGRESPAPAVQRVARPVLGASCAVCGAIHLLVASGEGSEWIVAGITLAGIGAVQLLLAGALLHGVRPARAAAAWLSLGVATLWAMSTSIGLPVGPHPWVTEGVTTPGVAVSGLEFALAFVLFCLPGRVSPPSGAPTPLPEPGSEPRQLPGGVDASPVAVA